MANKSTSLKAKNKSIRLVDIYYLGIKDFSPHTTIHGTFSDNRHIFYVPQMDYIISSKWGGDFTELTKFFAFSAKSKTVKKIKKEFRERLKIEIKAPTRYYQSRWNGKYYFIDEDTEALRKTQLEKSLISSLIEKSKLYSKTLKEVEKLDHILANTSLQYITHCRDDSCSEPEITIQEYKDLETKLKTI